MTEIGEVGSRQLQSRPVADLIECSRPASQRGALCGQRREGRNNAARHREQ